MTIFRQQSCGNFVSKTNLKLGGINYEKPVDCKVPTLIVGYDVAHPGRPTTGETKNRMPPSKPSVVGVEPNVLNARFKWMLELFTKNRGVWPAKCRHSHENGTQHVSERASYKMVIDEELFAIKQACEEFGNLHGRQSWMPRFTVIVATKRHNAVSLHVEKQGRLAKRWFRT
ncbi:hypothetical protein COOONC_19398 [Cooperia oncophora]